MTERSGTSKRERDEQEGAREESERRHEERLPLLRDAPGLIQKYHAYEASTRERAGICPWDSEESLSKYLASDPRKCIPAACELAEPPRLEPFPIVDVLRGEEVGDPPGGR